jgi:hypothetical protein
MITTEVTPMMTRREMARAALAVLAAPFALGCSKESKDATPTNLNRPIVPPAGTAGPAGKSERPQKPIKPES